MKKHIKPAPILATILVLSVLCNIITITLWLQERSFALKKVRESAGSIGFLRAHMDYDRGYKRLFRIEARPEFTIPGSREINTGLTQDGLEIWAVGSYSDKRYLYDFGDSFLNAYNTTMRKLANEPSPP